MALGVLYYTQKIFLKSGKNVCPKKSNFSKIRHTINVTVNKSLERRECVGQTIQESPWEVSVESVIGYEFVRDMQIKKTKIFPPSREAIPIVGWLKYMGESAHPNHDDVKSNMA